MVFLVNNKSRRKGDCCKIVLLCIDFRVWRKVQEATHLARVSNQRLNSLHAEENDQSTWTRFLCSEIGQNTRLKMFSFDQHKPQIFFIKTQLSRNIPFQHGPHFKQKNKPKLKLVLKISTPVNDLGYT